MGAFIARLARLVVGLFLYALGIVLTINANIGYSPWDVFHSGLSASIGISIGAASILVGSLIVAAVAIFREKVGLGTILNMLLIGIFMDGIMASAIVPKSGHFAVGVLELLLGLYVISFASFLYIGSGFGAGPRDSLMVLLTRRIGAPVGVVRAALELLVIAIGWALGGKAGLGTFIASVAVGFCIQSTFHLLGFDPTAVRHADLRDTFSGKP